MSEASFALVQYHAQVAVMLVVVVPALGEATAVVPVQMISLVSVHLGLLESVVKIFKVSKLIINL